MFNMSNHDFGFNKQTLPTRSPAPLYHSSSTTNAPQRHTTIVLPPKSDSLPPPGLFFKQTTRYQKVVGFILLFSSILALWNPSTCSEQTHQMARNARLRCSGSKWLLEGHWKYVSASRMDFNQVSRINFRRKRNEHHGGSSYELHVLRIRSTASESEFLRVSPWIIVNPVVFWSDVSD